jgi:ATP-binding cassette subfamily B protein
LDAALRLVQRTSRATGQNRRAWNDRLFTRARSHFAERPAAANAFASISLEPDALCTHGTVLLMRAQAGGHPQVNGRAKQTVSSPESRPEDSARQIPTHRPSNPGWLRSLLRLLGPQARVLALGLFGAVLMLALASALELLLYRAAVDAPNLFTTFDTRFAAALSLGSLVLVLLGLETAAAYGAANLGRHLELELRVRTLYSLPRTGDAFVRSRPTTDLAYRAHNLVTGGRMPATLIAAARAVGDLGVTLVAIAWLGTAYLLPVSIGALLLVITLSTSRNRLRELDTRNQVHASRLLSLFLDALRGCRPIRLHGYQDSFRLEQQRELERSRLTAEALVRTGARLEAVNGAFGALLLVGVLLVFVANAADPRLFVLLAFWAFRIPPTIRALVGFAQAQPLQSVALQRLLEVTHYVKDEPDTVPDQPGPIEDRQHAAQEPAARAEPSPIEAAAAGVAIEFEGLTVLANQYAILNDVSLRVAAGEHVAIVGRSGSGKSSLVGLLLGFHEPTAGRLTFDGRAYGAHERRRLLSQTVWVDPSVQLWNRSVRDNVEYAARATARRGFLQTAELSELLPVIDHLERGLDTSVGPEGCLLSGGEGQRVRLARGLRRAEVRLVILDEAFRGLDRPMRERLTRNVRAAFPNATLFSVSHDIRSALEFERVLVIESGRIVEDGAPTRLACAASRFKSLLDAEMRALEELWAERAWRRLEVARGKVTDEHPIH